MMAEEAWEEALRLCRVPMDNVPTIDRDYMYIQKLKLFALKIDNNCFKKEFGTHKQGERRENIGFHQTS
jgi:hypothetical protein